MLSLDTNDPDVMMAGARSVLENLLQTGTRPHELTDEFLKTFAFGMTYMAIHSHSLLSVFAQADGNQVLKQTADQLFDMMREARSIILREY